MHFNGLTPAEAERLALLLEELGEVQQVIGKILRHGYESRHPNGGPTNRELLERELGDVRCAVRMMTAADDLRQILIDDAQADKEMSGHTFFGLVKAKHLQSSHALLVDFLETVAHQLDAWAEQSLRGGWSTHQVEANRKLADECRRIAANARRT